MYADKDSRGLVSVLEMDRPDWTALIQSCEIAAGIWRTQLKVYDGYKIDQDTDTAVLQRIMYLRQSIASAVNFVNWVNAAVNNGKDPFPYNPFNIPAEP